MKGIPITISLLTYTPELLNEGTYLVNVKQPQPVDLMCLGKNEVLETPADWQAVKFIAFGGHEEKDMTPVLEHEEIISAIYTAIDVPSFVRDMRSATVYALEAIMNNSGKAWLKRGRNDDQVSKLIRGVWEHPLRRGDKFVIAIKNPD
jgi:hypothetical protein